MKLSFQISFFKKLAVIVTGCWLLAGAPLAGATPGGHQVGIRQFSVPYHDQAIDAALWYPTASEARRIDAVSVEFSAAPDAPIKPGRFPLVVVSHGTGGMKLNHYPIVLRFVEAGYIVVSLTHPGDNFRDRSLIAGPRYFHERPRQISLVLDHVLANPELASSIDPTRIAALGHSAGGYAVAALAGATPDRQRLTRHCQQDTDDPSCQYADPSLGLLEPTASPLKLPASVRAEGPLRDERIRAAILLAPFAAVIAPGSLAATDVPVRLVGAENDEILARRYHYQHLANELKQRANDSVSRASIQPGAGHFSFLAPFKPGFVEATRDKLGNIVVQRPGVDRAALQQALAQELIVWLDAALRNR